MTDSLQNRQDLLQELDRLEHINQQHQRITAELHDIIITLKAANDQNRTRRTR